MTGLVTLVAFSAPILIFLYLCRAFEISWRLSVGLLLAAPTIACSLTLVADVAAFPADISIRSFWDIIGGVLPFFIFVLPDALYPRSTWIALIILLAAVISERRFPRLPTRKSKFFVYAAAGAMVGALFGLGVYLLFQTPLADLGNYSDFTNRYRPPPLFMAMAIFTGAVDGLFVAAGRSGTRRRGYSVRT